MDDAYIHPSADVSPEAQLGPGTRVWHQAHIREGAVIGASCIIGKDVYVDVGVRIGNNVKVQNSALLYHGAEIEDGVLIGPQACLTNDRHPRAITPEGRLKDSGDWVAGRIIVRHGASVGAGAIILTDVTIGVWALVGAGAVVTHDVPDYGLVIGSPARLAGYMCPCGQRLRGHPSGSHTCLICPHCGWTYEPEKPA